MAYFLLSAGCGYILVRYLSSRESYATRIVYSIPAGAVFISFFMFISSLVTGNFFAGYFVIFLLAASGIFFLSTDALRRVKAGSMSWRFVGETGLFVGIALLLGFHLFMHLPLMVRDAWASYGLKGKIFFIEQRIPLEHFKNQQFLQFLRLPFYPLNLSLNESFLATLLGDFNETKLKMISLAFGLMSINLVYLSLKKFLSVAGAFLLTGVFAFTPMVILHSASFFAGLSDILFMFYNLAAAGLLYEFSRTKDKRTFFLSSFFAAASLWTKFEGSVCIFAILAASFFLFGKREWVKICLWYLLLPVALNAPWWIIKFITRMEFVYTFIRPHPLAAIGEKLGMLISVLSKEFVSFGKWGWVWLVVPVAVAVNIRKLLDKGVQYFLAILLVEIAGYIFVLAFLSSPGTLRTRIKLGPPLSVERQLLHVLPFAVLAVGATLGRSIFGREKVQ